MTARVPRNGKGRPLWYGRRQGHKLRPNRRRLVEEVLPRLRVEAPRTDAALDPASLFEPAVEGVHLEIGFGGGEHLAGQAAKRPDIGFVGFEPFINGVASLLAMVEEQGLRNVRIYDDDARLLLDRFADASVGRVYVLFPDPWPKRRHHRRRILQTEFLDVLARVMRDGADLVFASDHMGYVAWTLERALRHPAFDWTAERRADWAEPPADWIPTRYEAKARQRGEKPVYLIFRRLPRA